MTLITRLSVWAFMLCAVTIQAQTTYYSKATATDFNDVNSWGTNTDGSGTSPGALSSPDIYIIQNAAALSLSANAAIGKLTITSGSLTVSANQLDVAITSQNNSTLLVNGGTLNLSGTGNIVLNGNLSVTSGTFNQSGGAISIDGNNNNVAATSVASGTHLFAFTGGTPNFTAGTITIVDPPVNTYTTSTTRAISISLAANTTGFSGTHTFVLGDGISTTPGNTDGFTIETYASSIVYINNLTVNSGNAAGRWGCSSFGTSTSWGTYIKGTLTINSGSEFRANQTITSANNLVIGSIVNNGTFTSGRTTGSPTLFIGSHATATWNPIAVSMITGSGVFRNNSTTPTAFFNTISFVNPLGVSFDAGTLALGTYAGHVSGTMTMTTGSINTNGQDFILGVATGTLGTLTYTAGGFTPGSTFGRWYAATTVGTTITASAAPTFGTGSYPFVSGTNNRNFHINRPATTGATGGILKVTYTDGVGMASITPVTDGTYSIDRQSNANWTVTTGATFAAGTGTFTYAINGQGIYTPINTNGRLLKNGTLVGTHQTGTTVPIVQRSAIPAASFTGTFNVGLSSSDIPAQTVQSGAWEDPTTWGGTVPTCTSAVVASGHTVTVSASTTGNCSALNIAATGSLLVTSGSLTVGCTNNNALLINNGTLNVSGGTLTVNGNISNPSGSTFTQSGGDIIVDGNNGNTTATSVASGTALVSFATNNVNLTGGKLTIVDPHAGVGTETAIAYTPSTTPYPNVTTGHITQFGNGVSTTSGGSVSGFRITQGTRLAFGNIIVNTLSGRYVYSSANIPIYGNLTITNGEFQIQSGNINLVAGNIENNGTLTTIGTLYFGTYTPPSTLAPSNAAQTVSGTGIFRNSATASTANFALVTVNNTNAAGVTFANANSLLNGTNTGTVSGTLAFTAGSISTGSNEFVLGTAVGALGTLSHTAGGFASGSKFTRWFPTATGGTAIASATLASPSSAGSFPFASNVGVRAIILQQTTAPTLGGKVSVVYNANGGGTTASSIVDGTYTVDTRSNESWTISTNGITGTPTYNIAISAQNLYNAANGNSRVTLATAPATGTHQTGTNYPHAQRTGITLNALVDTYYIGASNTDIPFQSIATGNWEDGTTWNKGVAPSCTDAIIIGNGHNVTVNAIAGSCQKLTINTGGTLTVAGSSLTNGCTLNNNALTNNGTLTVTGGTLNINGNLICAAGSTFNQSGGDINIDGNGGTTGINVANGVSLCQLSTPNINWTGGNLTIIDPHANVNASESFTYTNSTTHVNVTSGHTLRFGDGISTDAGGNATNGFRINTWSGTYRFSFNNLEINTGTGTNRHVTMTNNLGVGVNGNFTITSGEFRDNVNTIYFAKNLTNNGIYVSTGVVYLGTFLGGTVGVSSSMQTVSGVGTFSNNATLASKTADVLSLTINNNNASGITLDRSLSVSGTLTMTNGVTTINPTYALTLGTATAAGTLSGAPSVTNMLKGTFARTFAANRPAVGTYSNVTLYPLGSGSSYLPIWIDPVTATTGPSIVSASAFDTNSGTTGAGVSGLSPFRWEYSNTAANLTSAFFRISQTGLNNGKAFVQSTSAAGAYDPIVGVTSTVAATNLTSSSIPVGTMTGFLSYGDLTPCIAPADQATNWVSTAIGTTTLSASYTAATSAPTGYIVVRYPTGSTPTSPVDLTTYATGNALGTGTVVYFGAATSFSATGLVANTTYDFYVYDYNNSGCAGPIYNSVAPLLSTVTTCASAVTAPTSSAGTAITTTGFTANWTASTTVGVTDYFIDISTSSTYATLLAGYPLSVSTATSYSVTGLSPNTTYYYRVRANVGVCSSTNSTSQTVVTDCAGEVAPTVVQPFTTYLPSCWKEATGALTTSTVVTGTTSAWATETGFGNTGTNPAVRINLYSTKNDWVISQPIDLGAGGYRIQYKMGVTSYLGTTAQTTLGTHKVDIVVSTDAGATWSNANIVKTYTGAGSYSATGQIETIDLIGYTGVVKIGFLATTTSTTPDIDFHIDDFEIIPMPSCVNPSNLATTNFNATSVDFSWVAPTQGTSPAGFNWEVRTSGAGGSGATGLVDAGTTTNTFASSTLLSATTAYSIYVQTDCGAGSTSTWTGPLAITTPCASISTFPWNEGFEGITTVSATAFPSCWKKENGDWQSANAATNTYNDPRTGTKYITETYSATNEWIWSPTFQLTAGVDYSFKFWFVGDGLTGWTGEVGVNSNQNSTGATIIGAPFINPTTTAVATYQEVVRTFTPSTTGDYSFGIRINANSTPWYLGFDDFSLDLSPTCQNPTDIALTAITGTSADFSWTAPASGNTPSAYNWEVRTSGAGGSGTTGLTASGNVATTAATATGLNTDTNYSIYVQSDCSAGNTSTWFGPFAITTPCASVTLPVIQDFEGSTTLTNCWKSVFVSGTKAFSIGTTTTAAGTSPNPAAQQGTNRLLFPSYSTSGNQTRLVSPPMDASNIASIDAKFQWYESITGGATSYLTEGVQVQYSYDGINWTNTGSLYRRYGATTGWFAKKETITGNVPVIYVGFLFTSNAGYDSYIDAINIESTPTCVNPTAITTTTITATSVDFTWTAPSLGAAPSAYNWEIRTSGAAGSGATGLVEAGSVATNVATSTTLLAPTTTYSIYVQSDCNTSGISTWFGPFTFTTSCASVSTFPYLEPFTTFLPGCWSNFGQGGTPATGPTVTTTGSWTADGFINSGTTGATKVNLYSNTKNSWLISPTFNLSNVNATYQLKYKVALTTWNGTAATTLGSDDEVQTLISTDGGATWSSLKSYTSSTVVSNTGVTESIDLTGYNSNNVKIAFWATEGIVDDTPDNDFFLDDVAVIELTNCSGTPAAAVVSSTSSSVCAGSDIVLNATGLIDSQNGLVYQWQSSDNGGASWTDFSTPITFKTNSTVTVTAVSVNTSFRLLATCTASGNLSNPSNTVDIVISTVTGGSTIASATSVCSSTTTSNTTLSVSGATAGVTYQWQSSPNGTTFTNITGATNATYAATVSTPTYFQCVVTCGVSTATSSPVSITLKAANQCYCIPVSAGSSCISNVKIGTINNTSAACASPWYSVQSATTNINKGANYQISVTTVDAAIISVWIDYNQNGTFEASEWKQVATASTANVASVVTLNIPNTALLGSTGMRIRSRATLNPNGSTDACTTFASGECEDYYITIVDPITTVTAKTYLNNVDQATGIMDDYVKTLANFPLSDPYSSAPLNANFTHVNSGATATTTPVVLAVTGNNAIVDWVFLELRTGASGATTVQYTKAALLQKDGDIVDVDGVSPVAFPNAPAGNYFVAVRHRNHLGYRTDNLIALSNATPTLNFTNGTVPLYGSTPVTIVSPSLSFMNGGDSNSDGSIDAFDTILWEIQNGLFDDYTNNSDYNLDGSVDAFDTIIWELNNGKYQELD